MNLNPLSNIHCYEDGNGDENNLLPFYPSLGRLNFSSESYFTSLYFLFTPYEEYALNITSDLSLQLRFQKPQLKDLWYDFIRQSSSNPLQISIKAFTLDLFEDVSDLIPPFRTSRFDFVGIPKRARNLSSGFKFVIPLKQLKPLIH